MDDERDRRERRSSRDRDISWSEIDKQRDKSAHIDGDRRREPGRGKRGGSVTGLGRYKADLSRLFERGEAGKLVKGVAKGAGLEVSGGLPERQQALRRILDASNPEAVVAAVDAFRAAHGELPDDPEVLGQALVHPDEAVLLDVLRRLHQYLAGHLVQRKALLLLRVKELEVRADGDELREWAGKVRDLLGG
jgi:hypothetical protein